jgi:hypothetical protein
MLEPKRAIVSLVFLISMASTLVFAIVFSSKLLTIISTAVQFCALVWYVLTYIPYGRKFCMNCLKSCCCGANEEDEKSAPIV